MSDITLEQYHANIAAGKFPQPMIDDMPPGWFRTDQGRVYRREAERIKRGLLVEVGCFMGRSLAFIADACIQNQTRIVAVDPWETSPRSEFERHMRERGILCGIQIMQAHSVDAANRFSDGTIDLCFIDAQHDYKNVKADVNAWLPKMKPGGVMMGHDYTRGQYGVCKAVDEIFGDRVEAIAQMWKVVVLRDDG